ncbi:MAG: SCO family protein [Flavicella sp.]
MKYRGIYFLLFLLLLSACKKKEELQKSRKVTTLPFFNSASFTPEWIEKTHKNYSKIHKISDFSLTNQEGMTITQNYFEGKIYVADFFFTTCSGICRSLSLNMKLLQETFKNDPEVLLLSHSVTPDIDSVSVLNKYAENYGVDSSKWHLVTGDKEHIYSLARNSYFSDEDFIKTNSPSTFIHTENFLLIDKKGRIRGVYNGTLRLGVKRLIRHIKELKKES